MVPRRGSADPAIQRIIGILRWTAPLPMLTPLSQPVALLAQIALLAAVVALAAVGGAVIHRAWRGCVLGWAPTCARCGFDLRAAALTLPSACPECGRILAGSVIPGPRRTSVRGLVSGASFVALSLGLVAAHLLGVPRQINQWLLARRSLASFETALRADDPRAWRLAAERLRSGAASSEDREWILTLVLDRSAHQAAMGSWDEHIIGVLASLPSPPQDLVSRVLKAVLALPNPLRVTSSTQEVLAGRPFIILVQAPQSLLWLGSNTGGGVELQIEAVLDGAGERLRRPPVAMTNGESGQRRGGMTSEIVTAPLSVGEHRLTVRVRIFVGTADEQSERTVDQPLTIRVIATEP